MRPPTTDSVRPVALSAPLEKWPPPSFPKTGHTDSSQIGLSSWGGPGRRKTFLPLTLSSCPGAVPFLFERTVAPRMMSACFLLALVIGNCRFRKRQLPMTKANRKQALIIRGATVLSNKNGTAPGQLLKVSGKKVFLLPGPPHELRPICQESVWPVLGKEGGGHFSKGALKATGLPGSVVGGLIYDL